jgi:hypothetical protein
MDVMTTSLNGELTENVFMAQPKGFVMSSKRKKQGMSLREVHLWIKTFIQTDVHQV